MKPKAPPKPRPKKIESTSAGKEAGIPVSYRITISYDGTDYKGWQRQLRAPTIQGVIEDALARLAGKRIPIHGAGRTDAGVHAGGQVAGFKAALSLEDRKLQRALNGILPDDIRVTALERVEPWFHARKSAVSKIYKYRIVNAPQVSPFVRRYVLHVHGRLDVRAMRKAAAMFVRKGNFNAFSSNREYHPVRRVTRAEIRKSGDEIVFTIEADGFLRYMVRTIVGTLLEVGKGKIKPEAVEDMFRDGKRSLRSPTAPPQGLCLVEVHYPSIERPIT